jgi:ABC-2 type transport system permease protein
MNTSSSGMPDFPLEARAVSPAVVSPTRPLYWSVRRELWENRSIYIAPLAAGALYVVGLLISLIHLPRDVREIAMMEPAQQSTMLSHYYAHAGMLLVLTGFLVGIFYSLDALHSERRDRSILFWKSLPVSDLTTVLSKASIPLVVLPVIVFAITIVLQLIAFVLSTGVLLTTDAGASMLWTKLPLFQIQLGLLYSLTVMVLWHAPVYGWLIFVSGWARRATFLWAVLPPLALCVGEYLSFHTTYFTDLLLKDRLFGFAGRAFNLVAPDGTPVDAHFIPVAQFTPGRFLSSPGLWVGLIVAGALLFAAVRLRRYREPI